MWQHLTQDRPLLWFLYAISLSFCFLMFPTDSLLITACIVPLYFVHTENKPLCSLYDFVSDRGWKDQHGHFNHPLYHTGCRMSWVPSSLSALCKMWSQSWMLFQECCWLCHAQRSYSPLLLLSVSSGPALLSAAWLQLMLSWHCTCSLSEWGYVSYSFMYLLCQTMLIEWAIWQNTWRVPSASSLQQLWEKMDIATGTQQSGENLDVVGLGDAKMQRRAGAIFSLFCMCAEFRHKSPVLRANRVRTLCASYNFALLPHSSKGFITSHCLWTVQSIKVDLCSVDAPHCLLELETLSAHFRV